MQIINFLKDFSQDVVAEFTYEWGDGRYSKYDPFPVLFITFVISCVIMGAVFLMFHLFGDYYK